MSGREQKQEPIAIQDILRRVFLNYSVSGTRYNMNYIRLPKFIQLCEDAHVIDSNLKPRDIESLFHSVNKRNPNMAFKVFLETFSKLSDLKYPQIFRKNPGEAFSKLIMTHFLPLAEELQEKREIVTDDLLEISDDCKMIIHNVHKGLRQLYLDTFQWETENDSYDNILNKSQNALEVLLRELDIYPSLISKSKIYSFCRDIIIMQDTKFEPALQLIPKNCSDIGRVLTLGKFVLIIYLCSIFGYQDSQVSPNSNSEKLLILLERMELTRNNTIASKNSLLPTTEVMQIIMQKEHSDPTLFETVSYDQESSSNFGLDQDGAEVVERYAYRLQRIFQVYCAYSDALNTSAMKSSNLLKLLKDCGLLSETQVSESFDLSICRKGKEVPLITAVEIDLIFTRMTGLKKISSKNQKMTRKIEFQQFLKALEIIARKIYPALPIQEAYHALLEEFILKLEEDLNESRIVCSDNIKESLEGFKNDDTIEALSIVHRSVLYFYRYYADNQNLMNYDNFIVFCRDFELFPDLVSKTKLVRFFYTLAGMSADSDIHELSVNQSSSRSSLQDKPKRTDLIDEHLFVEALALISEEVKYEDSDLTAVEKVCYLMERMSQSKGPAKVLKQQGHNRSSHGEIHDLLSLLKVRYAGILDHTQKKQLNFDDLASLITI